jgi:7-cyano-7-deazaguanine reductase
MKGPLGKKVAAPKKFDPKVLFPISRTEQRKGVFEKTDISTIKGDDVWNIHELLWIDKNNNSHHNELSISLNCTSKNTVESKSMKLFLGSLVHKKFKNISEVKNVIKRHIEAVTKSKIKFGKIYSKQNATECEIKISSKVKALKESSYTASKKKIFKTYVFKAFRSLCPVTNQPDIADVYLVADLSSQNKKDISEYLGSFFEKNSFHERCVEEMFLELKRKKYFVKSIEGYFKRRGGIAIIPRRYSV